jgi:hypothetical protein
MLVILNAPVPEFLSVTAVAALVAPSCVLANATDVGDRVTAGAVPVPVKATVWGLPVALSVMETVPDLAPVAEGVKVTLIEQMAPAAKLEPQVFVCAKSVLLVPVIAMPNMLSVPVPLLVIVTTLAALVAPTNWLPNARDVGDRVTAGATPVPVRAAV